MSGNFIDYSQFKISRFRIVVTWMAILLLFGFLITRLLWIQILHPERLISEGNNRVERLYSFEPARGLITDRFGKILAISVPVKAIYADALVINDKRVIHDPDKIRAIAAILQMDPRDLFNKLSNKRKRNVLLSRHLATDKAQELEALKVPGIMIRDNYQRYYPTGRINAHLIGLLNADGKGTYGVEQSFNTYLSAQKASHKAIKDGKGHIIENLNVVQEGRAGGNLRLSIDDRLQTFAFSKLIETVEEFDASSAMVVMIDVKTGEVLVMVNYPSFDPNDRSHFIAEHATNRIITDTFEPGSTVKPIIALSALENKAVTWNEVFDTRPYVVDGKTIRDTHFMEYGTLKDILKFSSNTGMAHITQKMGPAPVINTLQRFGFGQATSSGLVGESSGRLNENRRFWAEIDKATLGYGYGYTVTALQLASAYATLANNGARHPVSILSVHKQPEQMQVGSIQEIKRLQSVLETIVSEGTGSKASITRYRIAGKTGTARVATRKGYSKNYISSFAGFAPISNPRFAMVAVVREPKKKSYYGGAVSGPIFQDVMTRALQLYNVPPDAQEKP